VDSLTSAGSEKSRANTKRATILVVDDNKVNLSIVGHLLSDAYEVIASSSAEEIFGALERERPHLILLDVDMPEMNGYEAIKALKDNSRTRDIPVIFLTGRDDERSRQEGLALGGADFITKPVEPRFLKGLIERHRSRK
jgi:CheY-like chemotaxis protein